MAEFEKLYVEFERVHIGRVSGSEHTRRRKLKRRRAVGAGRKHRYALRDRLLMTLFWMRAYTTYKLLGTLYDLDKTTVEDYLKNVIDTLAMMPKFKIELPDPEVPKLRSMQEVTNAFSHVLLIIGSEE